MGFGMICVAVLLSRVPEQCFRCLAEVSGVGCCQEVLQNFTSRQIVGSIRIFNFNWPSLPENLFDSFDNTSRMKIHLANNRISKIPASSLAGLHNIPLLWLNISGNELTEMPAAVFALHNLITLVLNENRITALPSDTFARQRRMKSLFLYGNRLTTIKPYSLPENLSSLVLSNNLLTHLNGSLRHMIRLRFLLLSRNNLTSLSGELPNTTVPLSLFIERNHFTSLCSVDQQASLKAVYASHNSISYVNLSMMPKLEQLDLSHNLLTKLSREDFGGLPVLTYLNVSSNRLEQAVGLLSQLKLLKVIDISSNRLTSLDQLLQCGSLQHCHSTESALESLHAEHNLISELRNLQMPELINLYLTNNQIAQIGFEDFAGLPKLRLLFLSQNRIKTIDILSSPRITLGFVDNNATMNVADKDINYASTANQTAIDYLELCSLKITRSGKPDMWIELSNSLQCQLRNEQRPATEGGG